MLRSNLCDYSDAYIAVKWRKTVEGDNDNKRRNKMLIFKNNAPFRSSISKINNTFIDNVDNLDIATPMYNLLQHSDNYSMTSGSLCIYYRDEINDSTIEINNDGNKINNNKTITSKSFECKTKIIERTPNDFNTLNVEVVDPLKYLSNFCRFLYLPSINCEAELDLLLSKSCIISETSITPKIPANLPVQEVAAI